MKVTLINYTMDAAETLIYTKSTRLQANQSLQDIVDWSEEKKQEHLDYMRKTIKSSWEFVDYIFEISGVTRAFTHQLVRTRQGSYAQESQRTVDVRDAEILGPDCMEFTLAKNCIRKAYGDMIDSGVQVQDARNILPTGTTTSIIAKFNLRTLHEMGLVRLCTRTQGEYQEVFKQMRELVCSVHPWAADFIKVKCAWDGVCAFPNYTDCPIQKYTFGGDEDQLKLIESEWEQTDHVANPIAKDGRTM